MSWDKVLLRIQELKSVITCYPWIFFFNLNALSHIPQSHFSRNSEISGILSLLKYSPMQSAEPEPKLGWDRRVWLLVLRKELSFVFLIFVSSFWLPDPRWAKTSESPPELFFWFPSTTLWGLSRGLSIEVWNRVAKKLLLSLSSTGTHSDSVRNNLSGRNSQCSQLCFL